MTKNNEASKGRRGTGKNSYLDIAPNTGKPWRGYGTNQAGGGVGRISHTQPGGMLSERVAADSGLGFCKRNESNRRCPARTKTARQ